MPSVDQFQRSVRVTARAGGHPLRTSTPRARTRLPLRPAAVQPASCISRQSLRDTTIDAACSAPARKIEIGPLRPLADRGDPPLQQHDAARLRLQRGNIVTIDGAGAACLAREAESSAASLRARPHRSRRMGRRPAGAEAAPPRSRAAARSSGSLLGGRARPAGAPAAGPSDPARRATTSLRSCSRQRADLGGEAGGLRLVLARSEPDEAQAPPIREHGIASARRGRPGAPSAYRAKSPGQASLRRAQRRRTASDRNERDNKRLHRHGDYATRFCARPGSSAG